MKTPFDALVKVLSVVNVVAIVGLVLLISRAGQSPAAPSLPPACTDCLIGCECGDCVRCLAGRPAAPAVEPCKCGPLKGCKCTPARPAPPTVNVVCCFCKHSFPAPASVSRTQCPRCLAPLFVQAGATGEVGALKKDAVPR